MSGLDSSGKLEAVRGLMRERSIDVYVVPSEDSHASEYLAPCDARRAYFTGFTGSAGCAVVTNTDARCWTDGRYYLQAEKQLGKGWTLMKQGMPDVPTWSQWLKTELPAASKIGIDPTLLPYAESQTLASSLSSGSQEDTPANSSSTTPNPSLVPIKENLIDKIWSNRPERPMNQIFQLTDQYTRETVGQKLGRLRERLAKAGAPGMVISQLDEVAWMFNLRGSDIPYNPVFFAYTILTPDECTLYVHPTSLDETVREYLHENGVGVFEYGQVWRSLESLGERVKAIREAEGEAKKDVSPQPPKDRSETATEEKADTGEKIVKTDKILIGNKTSWAIAVAVGEGNVEVRRSTVEDFKAKKNATEVEGIRQSHIRDGAALCRYFAWLEEVLRNGERWTEYDAAMVLEKYRRQNKWFMGLSFETISSTGSNAAVIHYAPPSEGSAFIDRDRVYLCDSGAQYLDGTTDTTRTLHFGQPSYDERRAFTRVLQGHISIDTVVFPQGTTGYVLDILARKALWGDGLDYRHSTSHGVGSFLNVHEGPQGVGQRLTYNDVALQAGHVMSNEPGYYADGKFGIRIESIVAVKQAETRENFGGRGYLELERVTMVPIQTKLVDGSLLTPSERA